MDNPPSYAEAKDCNSCIIPVFIKTLCGEFYKLDILSNMSPADLYMLAATVYNTEASAITLIVTNGINNADNKCPKRTDDVSRLYDFGIIANTIVVMCSR